MGLCLLRAFSACVLLVAVEQALIHPIRHARDTRMQTDVNERYLSKQSARAFYGDLLSFVCRALDSVNPKWYFRKNLEDSWTEIKSTEGIRKEYVTKTCIKSYHDGDGLYTTKWRSCDNYLQDRSYLAHRSKIELVRVKHLWIRFNVSEHHAGFYACVGTRNGKEVKRGIFLDQPMVQSHPPVSGRRTPEIQVGIPFTLKCRAEDGLRIDWFNRDTIVTTKNTRPKLEIFDDSKKWLRFDSTRENDAGNYVCYGFRNDGIMQFPTDIEVPNGQDCLSNGGDCTLQSLQTAIEYPLLLRRIEVPSNGKTQCENIIDLISSPMDNFLKSEVKISPKPKTKESDFLYTTRAVRKTKHQVIIEQTGTLLSTVINGSLDFYKITFFKPDGTIKKIKNIAGQTRFKPNKIYVFNKEVPSKTKVKIVLYGPTTGYNINIEEYKFCFPGHINGSWSNWSPYGGCSKTCGGGLQSRTRTCNNPAPAYGGLSCPGNGIESRNCSVKPCPVDGSWSNWSPYEPCSKTCGGGHQTRTRICNNPAPAHGGISCPGNGIESHHCSMKPCTINGSWSNWSRYGGCSKTCGEGGLQSRTRTCNNPAPAYGGLSCPGNGIESRNCSVKPCPVDGSWSNWFPFEPCSKTCGGGHQIRTRTCDNPLPAHGGISCPGNGVERHHCSMKPCPINGMWSNWSPYGGCSKTCGGGLKFRKRTCNNPAPAHGGHSCPGNRIEISHCSMKPCPVNGSWSDWSSYGGCSRTCGGGHQSRTRTCNNPAPAHGGLSCPGNRIEISRCSMKPCPVNGSWSDWSSYGGCSKTCGGGHQSRTRTCNNPAPIHGGLSCAGNGIESRNCSVNPCPINGSWSDWSSYGGCSKTCGGGHQSRTRTCNNPAPAHGGLSCAGNGIESRNCSVNPCPIDGSWSNWSTYDECSSICFGRQYRTRTCNNPEPAHGGHSCPGKKKERRNCQLWDGCPPRIVVSG